MLPASLCFLNLKKNNNTVCRWPPDSCGRTLRASPKYSVGLLYHHFSPSRGFCQSHRNDDQAQDRQLFRLGFLETLPAFPRRNQRNFICPAYRLTRGVAAIFPPPTPSCQTGKPVIYPPISPGPHPPATKPTGQFLIGYRTPISTRRRHFPIASRLFDGKDGK